MQLDLNLTNKVWKKKLKGRKVIFITSYKYIKNKIILKIVDKKLYETFLIHCYVIDFNTYSKKS